MRAVADGFALVTLPAAVNDSLDANAWRPTLAIRDSLTARVAFVLEAAFASRRETYECTLRRFAFPSAATLLKPLRRFDFPHGVRTPATTPAMKASEVWNACAGALREAAAVVSAIVASPPSDEGVVDVVRNGRNGRAGDRAAGVVATCVACLERVALVAEYALRGDLNVTDDVTAQSFQMGFDDAWTVMSAASRARRLARGCEAAVTGGVARWLVARRVGHRVGHRVSLHRLGVACRRRREDGGGAGDETRPRRRRRGGEGDSRVAPPGDDDARGRRVAALEVAQETGVHAERAAVVAARRRVGDIGGRGGGATRRR